MKFIKEFFLWLLEQGEPILKYINMFTDFIKSIFSFDSESAENRAPNDSTTELARMPSSHPYQLMLVDVRSDSQSFENDLQQQVIDGSEGFNVTEEIIPSLNVLGIFKNVGEKITRFEIKEAFKVKCLQVHPDKNQIDSSVFIAVKQAFEKLEKFLLKQNSNYFDYSYHNDYSYEYQYTAANINKVSQQIDQLLKMVRELIKMCEQIHSDIREAHRIVANIDALLKDIPDNQEMIQESKIFLLQSKIDSNRSKLTEAEKPLLTARSKKHQLELDRASTLRIVSQFEENYQKVEADLKQWGFVKSNTSDSLLQSQCERLIQENMPYKQQYADSITTKKQSIDKMDQEIVELGENILFIEAKFIEFQKSNFADDLQLRQQLSLLTSHDETHVSEEKSPVLCTSIGFFEPNHQEISNPESKLNIDF